MNIVLAAGIGNEHIFIDSLLEKWQDSEISLIGGKWDISSHTFPVLPIPVKHIIPHYFDAVTELDWKSFDLFVDLSNNRKSKYLLSQKASLNAKRCITLNPDENIYWWDNGNTGAAISQFLDYTYPTIPVTREKFDVEELNNTLKALIQNDSHTASIIHENGELLDISPKQEPDIRWEQGLLKDVCAVSCGDRTVSLSPTEDRFIDLNAHSALIEPFCTIKRKSPFFVEFSVLGLDCMLFKQGRLMVSGTDSINDGKYIYRWYVGS